MRRHLIQVSDLHLSRERAYNQRSWEACLAHIEGESPDCVIVTGDHVLDDPDCRADHEFARAELDRIAAPWSAIPGNHDIGDANPQPYMGQHVDAARLRRYLDIHGEDRFARELGEWRLIGLNAFLLGTDLAVEREQYDWLRDLVFEAPSRPLALFVHKPLCVERLDEKCAPDICVLAEGRRRLLEAVKGANLRIVASGHTHHYRTLMVDGVQMVWAPSTGQILHMHRPFRAALRPGVVHYWLDDNGDFEFALIEPSGIGATDITPLIARYGAMRDAPPKPLRLGASFATQDAVGVDA